MTEINITRRLRQVNIPDDTTQYTLPIASETVLGGIKVGHNLSIEEDGTLNAADGGYTLPVATASTLGGIKVGTNLSISDGVLSVQTDSILSTASIKPIQNATVAQSINTISGSIDTIENDIDAIEDDVSGLTTDVEAAQDDISTLDTTVGTLSDTVDGLSSTVSGYSSAITQNADDITALTNRVSTAEDDIDNLETDVTALKSLTDDEKTYSYLLPVSTWTSGSINLERRGRVGTLYVDIEGDLTLASGNSTIIYSYTSLGLFLPASSVLMTDDGPILGTVDDETNNFTLSNISAHSQHITKIKGSIPLVFS